MVPPAVLVAQDGHRPAGQGLDLRGRQGECRPRQQQALRPAHLQKVIELAGEDRPAPHAQQPHAGGGKRRLQARSQPIQFAGGRVQRQRQVVAAVTGVRAAAGAAVRRQQLPDFPRAAGRWPNSAKAAHRPRSSSRSPPPEW